MRDTLSRPDPDALLAQLKDDAALRGQSGTGTASSPAPEGPRRGGLKIFFGYAAGVGKTYAMLEAAHAAKNEGLDVAVGYVEPHARPETAALLDGLEQVPMLRVEHKGIVVREFDLDAALARKPSIILVDELAHTNAGGCRNRKRYQDIEELLRAGISVWTALNVQHLESLNDMVASMTGVTVRERVPDSVFDGAAQVELVDLEPEELIRRLRDGKVYREAQAGRALGNFFQPGNLLALREIAMRRMADRLDKRAGIESRSPGRRVKEHVLICLSGAPSNARVIRTAARMAGVFHADFTALFVRNTGAAGAPDGHDDGVRRLRENARLAEELGARVVTIQGEDVPTLIADYARAGGVSKIVTGRSPAPSGFPPKRKTLVERLSELAPEIDMYIIPDSASLQAGRVRARSRHGFLRSLRGASPRFGRSACITALVLLLCTLTGLAMHAYGMHDANTVGIYMLGVLCVALFTQGPWFGIAASALSVLLFDFLFIDPRFSLHAYDANYLATFFLMFLVTQAVSGLTARVRSQARQNSAKALHMELLLGNSRRLQQAENEDAILAETADQLVRLLGKDVVIYPVRDGRLGQVRCVFADGTGMHAGAERDRRSPLRADAEKGVACWVVKNGREAGAGTDTLPGALCLYLPIQSKDAVLGVIGIARPPGAGAGDPGEPLDAPDRNLARAMIAECALALEKDRLMRANAAIAARMQQEKLRSDVLRAISHDLRTPLTAICGAANMLAASGHALDESRRAELLRTIEEDADSLITMVENLLALTRLEQEGFRLRLEPELLEEVIREALDAARRHARGHSMTMDVRDGLLMARMEARLIVQVLANLLDNAIRHTPEGAAITVRAEADGPWARVSVEDTGPGIAEADKQSIFDMFHTLGTKRGDGQRGMGLGLSLCRNIIQAHGGSITVHDVSPHGAAFAFTLPLESPQVHEPPEISHAG